MAPERTQTRGLARFFRSTRGTMALTLSQMFMGALTIGIATFRGTEAYESFYFETQLGHANFAASNLAAAHGRSANSVANNNVISTTIMGPRFAVEADNLTMLANAAIACPLAATNPKMAKICAQFKANYPRMLLKLAWVRLKQKFLWGSLGKLSDTVDKITSIDSLETAVQGIKGIDAQVSVRAEDPSQNGSIWGTDSTATSCIFGSKDALVSPMPGAAFPILMDTLLPMMPKALTKVMPRMICGVADGLRKAGAGGTGKGSGVTLPEIPEVSKAATEECEALASQMQSQAGAANGAGSGGVLGGKVTHSSDVRDYVKCGALDASTTSSADTLGLGPSYAVRRGRGVSTCVFDMAKCQEEKLEQVTEAYLEKQGLPKIAPAAQRAVGAIASALGGSTHAPTDSDWNHSDTFRTCAFTTKPIDETILRINDAVNVVVSFGTADPSATLRRRREYQACGKTYFPDREGDFASTPDDEQPYVAAWKFALVGTGGARRR